jgi:DeoR family glycerol-3-phosphate regulon repressor
VFPRERRKRIEEIINDEGYVTVDDLAKRFSVSVDSIRKDLKMLANENKCRREYGGAVRIDGVRNPAAAAKKPQPDPYPEDELIQTVREITTSEELAASIKAEHEKARREVARRAYVEINDNDVIFLDISKTSLYIAELLAKGKKRVIVTTNMIDISNVLANNPIVTALTTGGYLSTDRRGYTGPSTISMLEALMFEKAFISASSISLQNHGVMLDSIDEVAIKQRVLDNATYKFLMAEDWKFGTGGGARFASIGDFDAVITNCTDVEKLRKITETGTPALC